MKRLNSLSDIQKLFGIGLFFFILFLVLYPTNILIADEWIYFRQGLAYSTGNPFLIEVNPISGNEHFQKPGEYPLGTPFFLAILIFFFGKNAVFLQGMISLLGAYFFTIKALKNLNLDPTFALIIFIFFPTVLLSRTLMSDLPSLLMISWMFYFITLKTIKSFQYFAIGFLAGFACIFREPNILLTFPFLSSITFFGKNRIRVLIITGFAMAIFLRLFGSYWAFGDPSFMKDPHVSFSLTFFIKNIIFYFPFLMIFIPAGVWSVYKYRGKLRFEIQIALISFIGLYLIYGYNGTGFSGLKSIFLGPRFLIPSLPLFAICIAKSSETKLSIFKPILLPASVCSILVFQFAGHYYNTAQQKILSNLENNQQKVHLLADLNTLPKIFYPESDDFQKIYLKDTILMKEIIQRDTFMYVETTFRNDNDIAKKNTQVFNQELDRILKPFHREEVFSFSLPDRIMIKQYKISLNLN